jgi:YHS domain-containing protein
MCTEGHALEVSASKQTTRGGLCSSNSRGGHMAIDPVCKMEVEEESAPGHTEYDGQDYYFCSKACEQKFEHNPTEYIDQQAA